MTYLRKLEPGEIIQSGDLFLGDGRLTLSNAIGDKFHNLQDMFRPVTITEAPPEPPAHRVEDETYRIWMSDGRTPAIATVASPGRASDDVCKGPSADNSGFAHWPQRAKRIVSGQEALKLLALVFGGCYAAQGRDLRAEYIRILAMLKD